MIDLAVTERAEKVPFLEQQSPPPVQPKGSLLVKSTTSLFVALLQVGIASLISEPAQAADHCANNEALIPAGIQIIKTPVLRETGKQKAAARIPVSGFCVSVDEVSVAQYMSCVAAMACQAPHDEQTGDQMPIHSVTFAHAVSYANWLSEKTGRSYRLPTEAEWQQAALGGSQDHYPWRNPDWPQDINIFSGEPRLTGSTDANPYGVRDMIGNLSEFILGCFDPQASHAENALGEVDTDNCQYRMTKGGHYSAQSFFVSPYFTAPVPHNFASPQIGFRVVRSLE